MDNRTATPIRLVGFDGDDTLWRSQDFFDAAQLEFEGILAAYVDLGGAFTSGQSGGSLDETLAVYSLVNALTVNLPGISAVQILVEGQQVDTLAGHLDLRYPLGKALDWVRKGS